MSARVATRSIRDVRGVPINDANYALIEVFPASERALGLMAGSFRAAVRDGAVFVALEGKAVRFVFPHAPKIPVTANGGMRRAEYMRRMLFTSSSECNSTPLYRIFFIF